ncbi:acetyltransferase [Rufibacter roseus]|uniref:Acetyltransferase n=1 Tax=Rufibacter roseus TaxID=1567108 RepID=A0ABW2DIE6_9BACT|nr:acetyltransferase [Rufibacter roseus]
MSLKKIVIVGTGGLGREVLMLLHQLNTVSPQWEVTGFYDDAEPEQLPNHLPYLGTVRDLNNAQFPVHVAIGIGNPTAKADVVKRLFNPLLMFPVLVHPSVANEEYQGNTFGAGTIICQNCILTTNVTLGQHVFLNLSCTVGHDAVLHDFCSLMPQVAVSGGVVLGKGVYGGTNSTILQNRKVGAFTTIGAGAVVTQDLPSYCTAVGVPARVTTQSA